MAHQKKHQEEEHGESAPLWIVSFADLVTLMLSFFVILASANKKSDGGGPDPNLEKLATVIRAAFNEVSPESVAAMSSQSNFEELLRQIETLAKKMNSQFRGDSSEKGIYGDHFRVRRLSDGMEITMGGPVLFDPFSAEINPDTRQAIQQIGEMLKGHRNMVEVRGHAGDEPKPKDWKFQDAIELSYRRARAVAEELIHLGTNPKTIRLTAIGPNEPLKNEPQGQIIGNRRVEIIIRESLLDDYSSNQSNNDNANKALSPQTRPTLN